MKTKLSILMCGIVFHFNLVSQIYFDTLCTNNVLIKSITSNGYIGGALSGLGGFYVPKNTKTASVFTSALWLGGLDAGGQLHLAGQTYSQSGHDFTYGPYPSSSASFQWNKVWRIRKSMVDSFKLNLYSSIPAPIAQWPGNGNASLGQAQQLAPYKDLNNNGIYEPNLGEYPCIKGDEAFYAIYNDDVTHWETHGQPLGVEVHQMIYAFNAPNDSLLWNTVFFNYRIINRSNNTYNPFYVSMWADVELGYYIDDFVGSDVTRNAFYVYNADAYDESAAGLNGYEEKLPVAGFAFLDFPLAPPNDGIDNNKNCIVDELNERVSMSHAMFYNNNLGVYPPSTTNPSLTPNYWNYMQSQWKDSLPLKRTGIGYDTSQAFPAYKYAYPDSSDNQYGWGAGGNCINPFPFNTSWDEVSVGNTPGDRRILGTIGPMVLPSNGEICFTFAFVFAQDSSHLYDNIYPIRLFKHRVDQLVSFFNSNQLGGCGCSLFTSIGEHSSIIKNIYPNPAKDVIHIQLKDIYHGQKYYLTDISGKTYYLQAKNIDSNIISIDVSDFEDGYYILTLEDKYHKYYHPIIIKN